MAASKKSTRNHHNSDDDDDDDSFKKVKELAENDFFTFIHLIDPGRVLGDIHEEVCDWITKDNKDYRHLLVLMPRDHQKSSLAAYWATWRITKDPTLRILYISSTSNLAEKQLKMIKDILLSERYRRYWPEMVNKDENKRERWTASEISVDHEKRQKAMVRDPTVFTGGLTTSLTGLHCDIAILDDVVVKENAYTKEGREKVKSQYSLLASIESGEAEELVVGTHYHPNDLYVECKEMVEERFDEDGNLLESRPVYKVFERPVETAGDGSGEFLWPRQQREDGKWFGFNRQILATKKAKYLDKRQFYAQYYNNPNDPENPAILRNNFQYYDRKFLSFYNNRWYFKKKVLNVFAAMDFAFSLKNTADYTAIVVIGIDHNNNIYILDIDRFKTNKISDYYEHLLKLYNAWKFKKVRLECTAAQAAIVRELKTQYLKPNGIILSIDEYRPNRSEGSKEERIAAILEPRYDNLSMFHYDGPEIEQLEEELELQNPPHDDIKDALAAVCDIAVAPAFNFFGDQGSLDDSNVIYHSRFGGVAI